jgi:hypothetical protein
MASTHDYIRGLELPQAPSRQRGQAPTFSGGREALVIGAQLAEFSDKVAVDLRPAFSHGLLLAQLAADKAHSTSGDVFRWYDTFAEVLQKIGWLITGLDFQQQAVSDKDAVVHEAIVPVVATMLGPQAAAASIIMSILTGMQAMQQDTPWMTLFAQKSQDFHGAKFQLSYVDAAPGGEAMLNILCFGIEARQTITQVLFFKLAGQSATLKESASSMTISTSLLRSIGDALSEKVEPFVIANIRNIDI